MSMVQQAIEVSAPLHTVYEQLAAFENYPRFMTGVEQVTPIGNQQTHWVMDVDGHRREFDARITELSFDERVSWATTDGPLLAETLTVRPMGETKTQVIAQLEADIAFLMPSDTHGQQTLNKRLKHDLTTLRDLIESGKLASGAKLGGASSKKLPRRSNTVFGSGTAAATPASVAARIRSKAQPGAGWGTADPGTNVDITTAPGISSSHDLDDVLPPGRRVGGTAAGSAPMGGRTPAKDGWGDGMINEEDRGSAHDLKR
jgi:carbon monoxide dehydrogenase subunit G